MLQTGDGRQRGERDNGERAGSTNEYTHARKGNTQLAPEKRGGQSKKRGAEGPRPTQSEGIEYNTGAAHRGSAHTQGMEEGVCKVESLVWSLAGATQRQAGGKEGGRRGVQGAGQKTKQNKV